MADELDLDRGDPTAGETREERRRRRRQNSGSTSSSSSRSTSNFEGEIRSRLDRIFDRLAKNRRAAHDDELADVIEEDADAMAQGFLSVTTNIPFLRMPLIMILNLLEPLLAFGRVGRILGGRIMARRMRRVAEAEAAAAEYEAAANGGYAEVPVNG